MLVIAGGHLGYSANCDADDREVQRHRPYERNSQALVVGVEEEHVERRHDVGCVGPKVEDARAGHPRPLFPG